MADRAAVTWSETAVKDLEAILEYVAFHEDPARAQTLYRTLRERIATLTRFPRRARVVPELKAMGLTDFRELLVRPYRIFFRLEGRTVVLLGVLDGRRDLDQLLIDRALRL